MASTTRAPRVVNLDEAVPEDVEFRFGGRSYLVPGDPPLGLLLKLAGLFENASNGNVGLDALRELDRVAAVVRSLGHGEALVLLEHERDDVEERRVVLGDEDPERTCQLRLTVPAPICREPRVRSPGPARGRPRGSRDPRGRC